MSKTTDRISDFASAAVKAVSMGLSPITGDVAGTNAEYVTVYAKDKAYKARDFVLGHTPKNN